MSNETYQLEIIETQQTIEIIEEGVVVDTVLVPSEAEIEVIEIVDRGLMGPPGDTLPADVDLYDPGDLAAFFLAS